VYFLPGQNEDFVTLHYVESWTKSRLRPAVLVLRPRDALQSECVLARLKAGLARHSSRRPKRLLVFVNPRGGVGLAKKVFKTSAAPIMALCDVECTVEVTTGPGHVVEAIESCCDLEER